MLWAHGATLTPPSGIRMSRDLTFGVFVDTDGFVKRWQTATRTVSAVETDFPRPSPIFGVQALDISNDGHMVEYAFLQHIYTFVRFADLSTHHAYDDPTANNVSSLALAPSGTVYLDATRLSEASVISLPNGTVLRTYSLGLSSFFQIEGGWMSDSGTVAWLYEADHAFQCPVAPTQCTLESVMVALVPKGGTRSVDTGPGELTAGSVHLSRSGRFLLLTKDNVVSPGPLEPGPVQVVDWLNGGETLTASDGSHPSRSGSISDDGTIVATTSTGGWYEYAPAPSPT